MLVNRIDNASKFEFMRTCEYTKLPYQLLRRMSFIGGERTQRGHAAMPPFDPKRISEVSVSRGAVTSVPAERLLAKATPKNCTPTRAASGLDPRPTIDFRVHRRGCFGPIFARKVIVDLIALQAQQVGQHSVGGAKGLKVRGRDGDLKPRDGGCQLIANIDRIEEADAPSSVSLFPFGRKAAHGSKAAPRRRLPCLERR